MKEIRQIDKVMMARINRFNESRYESEGNDSLRSTFAIVIYAICITIAFLEVNCFCILISKFL